MDYYVSNACHPMDPSKEEIWAEVSKIDFIFEERKLFVSMDLWGDLRKGT